MRKDKGIVPMAIAGTSGGLVALMAFGSRWVLSSAKDGLGTIEGEEVVAAAVYDAAIEVLVLFGVVAGMLVAVQIYVAYMWWEYLGGSRGERPVMIEPTPSPTPEITEA